MLGYKIFELNFNDSEINSHKLYRMGTAFQAVFLEKVFKSNQELFESLHNNSNVKPYTVSPPFKIRNKYYCKVTSLEKNTSIFLKECDFEDFNLQKEGLEVSSRIVKSEFIDYKDFYELFFLKSNEFDRNSNIIFSTPTSFKSSSSGMYLPLPMPVLIFQSIINKWSNFASFIETKDPEILNFIDKNIAVSGYSLDSKKFPVDKGFVTSFTGRYSIFIKESEYFRKLVKMLLMYSYFSGIGIKTTMGMGQVSFKGVGSVILSESSSLFDCIDV